MRGGKGQDEIEQIQQMTPARVRVIGRLWREEGWNAGMMHCG